MSENTFEKQTQLLKVFFKIANKSQGGGGGGVFKFKEVPRITIVILKLIFYFKNSI